MLGGFTLSLYKFPRQILMVSSKGIFVNKESLSRLAMCKLESWWQISSAKWNEWVTVNSLAVAGVKIFSKNFANLLVGVPIAEKIVHGDDDSTIKEHLILQSHTWFWRFLNFCYQQQRL